jgi:surface polysaccharide O-acyltransferase-like enzyme
MTTSKRENSLDLLRIISTIAVILIHVNYFYFKLRSENNGGLHDINYVVESLINIVTRFSVPAFVMLSGAFLLGNLKNADFKSFYRKTCYKIFLPVIFVVLFLCGVEIIIGHGVISIMKSVVAGSFYNLWFMYMLFGLYILTPFLVILKKNIPNSVWKFMSFILLAWAFISQATSSYKLAYSLGVVFSFLGYFMVGNVLYESQKNIKNPPNIYIYIYILIIVLMYIVTFVVRYLGFSYYLFNAYRNFFSPTIMIASIFVFKVFLNIKIRYNLSKISSYTFYVYLFHTITYKAIFKIFGDVLSKYEILNILIVSIFTALISFLCALAYDYIWKFVDKKWNVKSKWDEIKLWKSG